MQSRDAGAIRTVLSAFSVNTTVPLLHHSGSRTDKIDSLLQRNIGMFQKCDFSQAAKQPTPVPQKSKKLDCDPA